MTPIILPRGIRLNNPGNIRHSKISWHGQSTMQDDPAFVRFDNPMLGMRALMRVLINYYLKHDIETIEGIIRRFAPAVENDVEAYIHDVCRHLGFRKSESLNLANKEILTELSQAITLHENGHPPHFMPVYWYENSVYADAAKSALN